jgi:hypothetical protein
MAASSRAKQPGSAFGGPDDRLRVPTVGPRPAWHGAQSAPLPTLLWGFHCQALFKALLGFPSILPCFLCPSPLFDPPQAWSNRAKRSSPSSRRPHNSAARRAGQKRCLLAAGEEPHGATRSPPLAGEHGEYGEPHLLTHPSTAPSWSATGHKSSYRAVLCRRPPAQTS